MNMGNKNSAKNNAQNNSHQVEAEYISSSSDEDDQRSFYVLSGQNEEDALEEDEMGDLPELDSHFGSTRTATPTEMSRNLQDFLNEEQQLNLAINVSSSLTMKNEDATDLEGTSSSSYHLGNNSSNNQPLNQQMPSSHSKMQIPPTLIGRHLSDAIRAGIRKGHFKGVRPIQLFSFDKEGELIFDGREWLQQFQKNPKYKDKLILRLVISGKYREGKSTSMNLFAEAYELIGNNQEGGKGLIPLECGFEWAGGESAITKGISFWPDPIHVLLPIGEGGSLLDVYIFLFDVQGLFDAHGTDVDIRLCTIANMLSTIFIYNVKHIFDAEQLQTLQKMLTLGLDVVDKKLEEEQMKVDGEGKQQKEAFHLQIQILYLLVRDCPPRICGTEGGNRVIEKWIKNPPATSSADLVASAKYLLDLFQQIFCFCLPMPAVGLFAELLEERLRTQIGSLPFKEEIGADYLEFHAKLAIEIITKIHNKNQLSTGENFGKQIEKIFEWTKDKADFKKAENLRDLQQERFNRRCVFDARIGFDEYMRRMVDSGKFFLERKQFNQHYEKSVNCSAVFDAFGRLEFVGDSGNFDDQKLELVHNYLTYCHQRYAHYKRLNESNKGWRAALKEAAIIGGIVGAGTVVGGGLGGLVGMGVARLACVPAVTLFASNLSTLVAERGVQVCASLGLSSGFFTNLKIHKFWKRKIDGWRNKNQKLPYHDECFPDALDAAIRKDPNHFFTLKEMEEEEEPSQSSESDILLQLLSAQHHMNAELMPDLLNCEVARSKQLTMDQIHGNEQAKRTLDRDCIRPFKLYSKGKLPVGYSKLERASKCILFYGEPGNGKTMMANALAQRCKATLFIVTANRILNMYVGQSERAVGLIFSIASIKQPAVIFFDEIDSLIGKRSNNDRKHDTQLVNTFLTCINEIADKQILVVGATNRLDAIDTAAIDRFQIRLHLELPNAMARKAYILNTFEKNNVRLAVDNATIEAFSTHLNGASYRSLLAFCHRVARNCRERVGPKKALLITREDLWSSLDSEQE